MTRRRKIVLGIVGVLVVLWLIGGLMQGGKPADGPDRPEFAVIERGNLDVPISATGSVEPAARADIKCKSSGTVMRIYFDAGDRVKKGDLLVELDPVDEERAVRSAKAEVVRAEASLALARSDAEKAERDWPMQIESALSGLEAARAALQGAVINFKRNDLLRQGSESAKDVTMDIVSSDNITPAAIIPASLQSNEKLRFVARAVALAEEEARAVNAHVEYGHKVINDSQQGLGARANLPLTEYQDSLITMRQAGAKVLAAVAELRNAVNLGILVNEAKTKVTLAEEGLRQALLTKDQAELRLKETKILAPFAGQIQEVFVKPGQIISSGITTMTGGTPVLILADVSKLYVDADVDEADIGRVRDLAPVERSARLGRVLDWLKSKTTQPVKLTKENEEEMAMLRASNNVSITVDALREETFTGKVDRVYPHPKNVNNIVTYTVRILLTSENRSELMLGWHANVKFTSRKLVNVLKVSNDAIKIKHEERGVYIPGPDNKPLFVPVRVGLTDGSVIEIKTDKLKEGQKVYTKLPKAQEEKKTDDD